MGLDLQISRRSFLGRLGGIAVSAALAAACGGKSQRISRPPNLVLINADDLGMGNLSFYASREGKNYNQ